MKTHIAKALDCTRPTLDAWIGDDPDYKQAFIEARDQTLDLAETKLRELINDKNLGAICFYLKTQGKSRGFIETQILDHQGQVSIHYDKQDAEV